ncbi:hypothetical protein CLHUN_40770 [Ruminiclostridium hungatei]|uniref:Uncharacterized protein n=1 Tax=Ruminiclostridium hungatei TaxID=48256 RepID=A0A1V4SDZ1_RUMHU|nr:hypothetical protein [Ruminiclostridium hungatei]OPX42078.1 hypothetical protein CLHUN_40770 [Ruminiclostridium hungatei]
MISKGLFTNNLPISIDSDHEDEETISQLLNMIDYSKNFETIYLIHESSLYSKSISGMDFSTWIFDYTNPELRDVKRELSIHINKSETLDCGTDLNSYLGDETAFIVGKNENSYVWDVFDYLLFKQNRLKNISNRSTFVAEAKECFMNIFFDETVSSSLRTLGKSFDQIVDEIIYHLRKLDEYYNKFQEYLTIGCSFQSLADTFTEFSGIQCSPQAGRDGVIKLTRSFINTDTGNKESVVCELHTKFSQHNRGRQKPDRVYFHPGKKGICEAKIIVIHIGEHL